MVKRSVVDYVDYSCFNDSFDHYTVHKCPNSDTFYTMRSFVMLTKPCPGDQRYYQACLCAQWNIVSDNNISRPMCAGTVEKISTTSLEGFNYFVRIITGHEPQNMKALFDRKINDYFLTSGVATRKECDGYCGTYLCEDEKFCNGVAYGVNCNLTFGFINETVNLLIYHGSQFICDGIHDCSNGGDEVACGESQNSAEALFLVDSKERQMCRRKYAGPDPMTWSEDYAGNDFNYIPSRNNNYLTLKDSVRCSALQYNDASYKKSTRNLLYSSRSSSLSNTPYQPICELYLDQINCADPQRVAISCPINGVPSTVSKLAICVQNPGLCDDGLDSLCVGTSISCYVHKHQLCNGNADCSDESDEKLADCQSMTDSSCFRRYRHVKKLRIPISWLGDGFEDCENGDDEKDIWPTCGFGDFIHFVSPERSANCQEVFICSPGSTNFVDLDNLCSSNDKCGHIEMCNQEEATKNDVYSIQPVKVEKERQTEMISYCLKGVTKSLSSLISPCVEENFNPAQIFGIDNLQSSIMIPDTYTDCRNLFGKAYIYLSCSGKCVDQPKCPLSAPRYDGCTIENKIRNRIFTTFRIDNNNRLTFLHKNKISDDYENRNFQCKNDKCIDFQNVCNLVDDCGDGSDEETCSNNFSCDKPRRFIARSYQCDGKIDCNDFSDECNDSCGKTILPGLSFSMFSWFVGSAAVVLNFAKLCKNIKILFTRGYTSALNDKVLTTVLHFGDLFTGAYLLTIAIVDSLVYGSSYCMERFKWISSDECAFLGVLSTFGAQLSLLAMTCLSVFRAIGTSKIQVYTSKHGGIKMFILALIIVVISFFLAYTPLMDRHEDFFVNAVTYINAKIKIFPSVVTKETHLVKIKQYFRKILISRVKSWRKINQLTDEMFSNQHGGLGRRKIHFYGNDGVCLFKYFVSSEDPQKAYVWGCLSWNFLCFLIIFFCYTKVLLFSKRSERHLTRRRGRNNDESDEDRRKTQKYVSAVIFTDFICWIPFIVLCVLHPLEVIDATPLYTVSSIVILPINSMINPILYNNFLTSAFKRMIMSARYWLTRLHAFYIEEILSNNNQDNVARGNNAREEIEMGPMSNQDQSPAVLPNQGKIPEELQNSNPENVRETEF